MQQTDVTSRDIDAYLSLPVSRLPLHDCLVRALEQGDAATATTGSASSTQPSTDHAIPLNLLLVEDNRVNQKVALRMLERSGCQTTLAENGQQALDLCAHRVYDLILMDCQMPVLDGFETTQHIRRRESESNGPRTPIIAMTANAMDGDEAQCLAAGMDDYISKPFSHRDLHALLQRWTQRLNAS